ncbi:helix-hairpin-helix domain-containing protein [Thalassotalea ponticola]|uniref:BRCT domain-containing protein n=1 Tax=Thalassotalea ponticola TaxID=1523392 RepID=UPI0025B3D2DD|nr:BRCT domain-containing protein [Thalassotalea ponticola]MDN3652181.1 helix-hairpin-helix domain-containing protein [Thalassotalea ponticola]
MIDVSFTEQQLAILKQLEQPVDAEQLRHLFSLPTLNETELLQVLEAANALYRAGQPVISDSQYDLYIAMLQDIDASHPYLHQVEPEVLAEAKTVELPQRMLSTEKAYSLAEIEKWIKRILKAAEEINVDKKDIQIRVTPKLDGYAAYDDGTTLYTRGDGFRGQDISRAFERGLQVADHGERGLGPGEIVIKKSYFDKVLSEFFENSRNIQAAIIAEKKVDKNVQQAIDDGACVFYPFALLTNHTDHYSAVIENFDAIVEQMWQAVDFDIDGVILETTNEAIKQHMGATRRNHRWQIAFKVNEESAEVEVLNVIAQTSRTGRISPVAELVPTKLSGATISRVTVHHYNMVKTKRIGPGAVVQLVRSGLVIPKIEQVIKPAEPQLPENCPSCQSHLLWEGDHLICPNKSDCPAQTENTLIHFFKTLGNNDGFGPKVIEKLTQYGVKHIHDIYALTTRRLMSFGFGEKTSQNLIDQLQASREIAVEDWRFLSAFGVSRLGGGNCEKLLQHHDLLDVLSLSVDEMVKIDGFAQVSAEAIVEGLANIKDEFIKVYELGFNISETVKLADSDTLQSPIAGAVVVFTGSMQQGSRADMEKQAKALGAKVAKSVSGKTNFLITGDKVGETKINAARDKGVEVLTEQQYLDLINGQ